MCKVTIITGTGRGGTTFLIGLLSLLRLPTGFGPEEVHRVIFGRAAHAGLERKPGMVGNNLTCSTRLQIYKSPAMLDHTDWLGANNLACTIVPLRKGEDAAASREYQSKYNDPHVGGFVRHARTADEQMVANDHALATFFWRASSLVNMSIIALSYPDHVTSAEYAYAKLKPFLDMYGVTKRNFVNAHVTLRNTSLVHSYGLIKTV